jgi:hypothetical protein
MKQYTQISYTDGSEQIVEFPVSQGNLKDLKIDGEKIMDIHDLTLSIQKQNKQLKKIVYFATASIACLVLALNLYHLIV